MYIHNPFASMKSWKIYVKQSTNINLWDNEWIKKGDRTARAASLIYITYLRGMDMWLEIDSWRMELHTHGRTSTVKVKLHPIYVCGYIYLSMLQISASLANLWL